MTETTLAPPANPALNAAIATVQAEYPEVAKDRTANTSTYSYDYADLASISKTVLPLLGKNGLAFISKPTRNHDGDFVLAYSLLHKSGEREDGEYPLPSSGNAQALGSAITYARRYSLCAITGIAPGGEDDDGAAASQQATQASRPRQAPRAAQANGNSGTPEPRDEAAITDWGTRIDGFTCQEDADKADAELREIFKAGRMSPTTANAIRHAIKAKAAKLPKPEMAGAAP